MEVWFVFYKFKSNLTSFVTQKKNGHVGIKAGEKQLTHQKIIIKKSWRESNESITFM